MIPVNVTVQFQREGVKGSATMRLSIDMTAEQAARGIVQYLNLPPGGRYRLLRQRQVLDSAVRLFEAGIQEGDILQLTSLDANATLGLPGAAHGIASGILNRLGGRAEGEPLPIRAALIANDGQMIPLLRTRALIGRADPSLGYPNGAFDAELTTFDPDRTVSRPHALIVYTDGKFSIRDLYSQSGVLVNGLTISPSQAQPIYDKDVLTFGSVSLQFRCESEQEV